VRSSSVGNVPLILGSSGGSSSTPTQGLKHSPSSDQVAALSQSTAAVAASATSAHVLLDPSLVGSDNGRRGRFTGTSLNKSAMISMDKMAFIPGDLSVKVLSMTPITNSKKSHSYFEMLVTCQGVQWTNVRTDTQFTALHVKAVSKLQLNREPYFPLKGNKSYKSLTERKGRTAVVRKAAFTGSSSKSEDTAPSEEEQSDNKLLEDLQKVTFVCGLPICHPSPFSL